MPVPDYPLLAEHLLIRLVALYRRSPPVVTANDVWTSGDLAEREAWGRELIHLWRCYRRVGGQTCPTLDFILDRARSVLDMAGYRVPAAREWLIWGRELMPVTARTMRSLARVYVEWWEHEGGVLAQQMLFNFASKELLREYLSGLVAEDDYVERWQGLRAMYPDSTVPTVQVLAEAVTFDEDVVVE
ncbi:hypothetical protein BV25DRAFT_1915182 [Artomyces pyxidatus]|uniref:Uncharacterized protein n=2 Tax=Artomyces pyxidatus TaxID=48021 RepID=A0ACB8SE70_9AGAM|nr:hypothetical protein BV25DRAFT_1843595 [Artomyces pyxidatus]KAI0063718.1 hypothetical protein BV25DRAFT_1915182 [Artomyces pyxidatus]